MAKRRSGSKNRGKSLLGRNNSNNIQYDTSQLFIGIVDSVIKKDSDNRNSYLNSDSEISDYVDNRNVVYVIPIDKNTPDSVVKAHFLNSHSIDLPIPSEAVLCCKTSVGYIIIDRFSPNAFGTNFELSDYLLSKKLSYNGKFQGLSLEITDDIKESLGIKPINDVLPFFQKSGSKTFLGRNNQYLIFDYGERIEADEEEKENSKEGSFVKLGLKNSNQQYDSKNDPSCIVLGENTKIQSLLESNIESEYNLNENEEPENGIGVQSNELLFFGRQFVVLYTEKDMLLSGDGKLYFDFQEIINKAEKIKLGKNAEEPIVLGNELVSMIGDLIDIILNIKHQTPQGPTVRLMPTSETKLRQFKTKYLRDNSSPIHSKKSFSD